MLVHGSNLIQKEAHRSKYMDDLSRQYLEEIRARYDLWHAANMALLGPRSVKGESDKSVIAQRVELLETYKTFIDQQKYAEQFDSRSNLHSSVLEEFLYYLFKDLVADFGDRVLIGKSHTFKDIFFVPPNYAEMTQRAYATIEKKDHDFIIGTTIEARLEPSRLPSSPLQSTSSIREPAAPYYVNVEGNTEVHKFDIAAVAIECKTYLDKTMLEGSSRAAEELKARNPNSLYIVVMEWLKLTEAVNLRKYKVDQIYVFRKQKNTDREYRFNLTYQKKPIDPEVVWHLYETVRNHLTSDWQGGIQHGLEKGWLL